MSVPGKTVAVVVPTQRSALLPDEEISVRHLSHFLGSYDRYLAAPARSQLHLPGLITRTFGDEFFHSAVTYSALLLSDVFYRAFEDYEYVLIYQLDALVFSDQLRYWCGMGLDYIGAPWLPDEEGVGFVEQPTVGNGGLSLRRVESFRKVIAAPGFASELNRYRREFHAVSPLPVRLGRLPRKVWDRLASPGLMRRFGGRGEGVAHDATASLNEDCFWSFRAKAYYAGFKISSVADALRFSFEVNPRRCYALNARKLPFGCHAWNKYDRQFWEPFLLK